MAAQEKESSCALVQLSHKHKHDRETKDTYSTNHRIGMLKFESLKQLKGVTMPFKRASKFKIHNWYSIAFHSGLN